VNTNNLALHHRGRNSQGARQKCMVTAGLRLCRAEVGFPRMSSAYHVADPRIEAVIAFWRAAGPGHWFVKNPAFDAAFQVRFFCLHFAAARRDYDHCAEWPDGALTLIILLDQYPRNAFRGTAHMYATDPLARVFAKKAVAAGLDRTRVGAIFLYAVHAFRRSCRPGTLCGIACTSRQTGCRSRTEISRSHCALRSIPSPQSSAVPSDHPCGTAFLDAGGFSG
jgi:hypothetical protein